MTELTDIASGLMFPEGPVVSPDGSVFVVEIARGTLSQITPDGRVEVVGDCGGGPNGAAFGPDGRIWVCNNGGFEWTVRNGHYRPGHQPHDYAGGSIQAVDIATGEVETVYTACDGVALRGPNDIVFDADGGFWFTDPGKSRPRDRDIGSLFYARIDGSAITEMASGLDSPNGVGLSPDGHTVYVAMTHTGRLYRWSLAACGLFDESSKGGRSTFVMGLNDDSNFDSLAVDSEGYICIATLRNGGITVVAPDGSSEHVATGDPLTTNICFGGDDLRTAYITCSWTGRLVSTQWPRPGLPLHHNPY